MSGTYFDSFWGKDPEEIHVDSGLLEWDELEAKVGQTWGGILLGNGASRAIWDRFAYPSLYDWACSADVDHPLGEMDQAIFRAMDTHNFEAVLEGLSVAFNICVQLGHDEVAEDLRVRYESIKTALIESVQAVHVAKDAIPPETLTVVSDELCKYRYVYSTNYDLVIYWAAENQGYRGFKDFFWQKDDYGRTYFDALNTEIWGNDSLLLFLHGALHLRRLRSGLIIKASEMSLQSLDHWLSITLDGDMGLPLFISEGTSEEKLTAIRGSEYLRFAHQCFGRHAGPLVIFGHSLGPSDQHLVDAINKWDSRAIAISIYKHDSRDIRRTKLKYHQKLWNHYLQFFAADTHPLGNRELEIPTFDW